jgi:hypothetical protein
VATVIALLLQVALLGVKPVPDPRPMSGTAHRTYFGVALNHVSTVHPYEAVCGQVTYVNHEGDTDWHLKIADGASFVVGEIMKEFPLAVPKVGQWIRAAGVTRWDDRHKFWELHPLLAITIVGSCKT